MIAVEIAAMRVAVKSPPSDEISPVVPQAKQRKPELAHQNRAADHRRNEIKRAKNHTSKLPGACRTQTARHAFIVAATVRPLRSSRASPEAA